MSLKVVKFFLIQLFVLMFLTACSSGSADGTLDQDQVTGNTAKLSLSVMLGSGQTLDNIRVGDSVELRAQLTLPNNLPISNQEITFSVEQGSLSNSARLTDDNGHAFVTFDSTGLTPGVISVTVSTNYKGEEITFVGQFELQAAAVQPTQPAVLTLTVVDQNNAETVSIHQGDELSITASLVSGTGNAIEQQSIAFTATAGSFSAASRLTTSSGLAIVNYDSEGVDPAVVTVTATTTVDGNELTASKQFEVLQAAVGNTPPSVKVTFKQDGNAVNRMQSDETAQIGVELKTFTGEPIANTIVNFSANLGSLVASSSLTNDSGIAEVTLTGVADQLGAGLVTASTTIDGVDFSDSLPYEVVDSDVVENTSLKLGYLDDNGNFQPGIRSRLTNSNAESTISAGGTLGLELTVFDQNNVIFTPPLTVTFTSTCVSNSDATIDGSVSTINGVATTTFEDVSCATGFGNEDTIVATISVNSSDLTATHNIKIQAETLGSIEFVSATPESIVLKGTGGQGKQETSTLTFAVKGELGNALAQQNVTFKLNTNVGGLALASDSGVTNSEGLVSAKVISGTVPTAVRVTASVSVDGGETISTQSDLLSVNTGLPDQNSMTIALSEINPEARNIIGQEVTVTVYMADSFNNPVPDGTTINFTTEGGAIQPSCNTTEGRCSVIWRSAEPFQDNHRVTILATANGHESFVDVNGNNIFDNNDGADRADNSVASGFGRETLSNSGFLDMSEAWRDDNENNRYDSGEIFIDKNQNLAFNSRDFRFNGPQCEGSRCSTTDSSIDVRKATVLITSSSSARYLIRNNSDLNAIYESNDANFPRNVNSTPRITLARGSNAVLNIQLSDTALQPLPVGTNISITSEGATLIGPETIVVGNTRGSTVDGFNGLDFPITLVNEVDEAVTGELTITVTAPSGVTTEVNMSIGLQ